MIEFFMKMRVAGWLVTVAVVAAAVVGGPRMEQKVAGVMDVLPTRAELRVARIVDGDTIELSDGEVIRYIGIDTPETKDRRKTVECFGKEASEYNSQLVLGKTVRLEKDVSETDKYGRKLRYVWVDDKMVNLTLVEMGMARAASYPPDVRYQDKFREAERKARVSNLGLWSKCQ